MTIVVTRKQAQWVHDMARARAGLQYAYGGAFTNDPRVSTDCSGLVLQTAAWYGGRTDWVGNRYGSTESFRLDHKIVYDLGFKRLPPGGVAALPIKPVMLVGLMHGGGGANSHTSCTLMTMDIPGGPVKMSARGVDWESHGNRNGHGVDLYDGARAWNDPMFHDFWYLDAVLEGSDETPSEMTVPLTQNANGTWTSPSPAWAHLIMRESSGNPTIIQQIHDVNSGGNEAEGLFQITPKTWKAHNGTEFAPTPRSATPQQQAIVAARIFTRNPSGSDWGAGLPGREDPQQLAAGLVPTHSEEDELADPAIQKMIREIHACLFNETESWSPLATPGEGAIYQLHEKIHSIDGMVHPIYAEKRARAGDLGELHRIVLAAKGLGKVRDAVTVRVFQQILADIERDHPEILKAYIAQIGPT
ncbi:endolysin [Mycobacterium phage EagleEye]|uniref:Lysin A n=1 Tax=Mycobacterium phage EagleEye TaxID=1429759 RepID=W0LMX6_9CAUD|nr:endolysin [Mycobacterium phage EagleEye]AHG23792.1 lysin A [Mycobacterium phage EagleEye]